MFVVVALSSGDAEDEVMVSEDFLKKNVTFEGDLIKLNINETLGDCEMTLPLRESTVFHTDTCPYSRRKP